MKVEFARVNEIFKTLPIGYYIGREVKHKLAENEGTSYYDILSDEITFSYPQVVKALATLPEGTDDTTVERFIRTMLYHELSHTMLTPENFTVDTYRNIVEDERIERKLDGYYMNTNFRELVSALNPEGGNTFDEFFFDVVRFRKGPKELLDELEGLLKGYSFLTRSSDGDWYGYAIDGFVRNCRDWYNQNATKVPQSQDGDSFGNDGDSYMLQDSPESSEEGQGDEVSGADETKKEGIKNQDEDSDSDVTGQGCSNGKREAIKEIFSQEVNRYESVRLQQELDLIFNRAAKAEKMSSSAINAYSGRFDPRSVVREDYKYFIQQNRAGSSKGFSKVHLNLFLDRSGSYSDNCDKTNELLVALAKIERSNPRFSFTIISCGCGETIENKKGYIHKAYDGTRISSRASEIFKKVQDKTATNYNIVLYDGFAQAGYNFSAFNSANTAIISDTTNKKNIQDYAPSARMIFVSDDDYANVLQQNVVKVLQSLVR